MEINLKSSIKVARGELYVSPRIIDLSMEVSQGMIVFPRVAPTIIRYMEDHYESACGLGTIPYGVESLTAHCLVMLSDHCGTHIDSLRHLSPDAPSAESIPLEYCYGDGVVLDFSAKPYGTFISVANLKEELAKINYRLKPLDIVLIKTGADRFNQSSEYFTNHSGMSREATLWLIEQGIKVMGIDAITFDPPIYAMFNQEKFWEAHRLMIEHEYYHIENMANLDQIPSNYGFKVCVFPVKWKDATAAPVRAVAIID